MPCHDILVETGIVSATTTQVEAVREFWEYAISGLNLAYALRSQPYVDRNGKIQISLYGPSATREMTIVDMQTAVSERFNQTYLAKQLFDALQSDGYEMHAIVSPEHEGTWEITARDISRNATIGVTVYRDMRFEIDFLDAMHDDTVWLAGGEFGRILEQLRRQGMDVNVVKMDIDEDMKRMASESSRLTV